MSNVYSLKYYLVIIAVLITGSLQAAFSISGSVITQTGTDTDLSGLSSISGVTISSQTGVNVYNIGNRRLIVQGTLTIDPEKEMLIIGYDSGELVRVEGSGHLIIGKEIIQNGFARYSEGMAIFLEDTPQGFTNRFSFYNNATFTWNGGVISIYAGKFGFYGDTVTVRAKSSNAKLIYRTQDPENQIRQETDDFISTGFSLIHGDLTIVGTGQQLNGYQPTQSTGAIAFSSATPNVDVILKGYEGGGRGNTVDIKHWGGSRPILINSALGSNLICGPHISGHGNAYGIALVKQEFKLTAKNVAGNGISNAKFFIKDTNHGNRETYSKEGHTVNNSADKIYTGITNSSGSTPTVEILLAANIVNTGNSDAPNTGSYAWDYRGKNNDHSDLFDVNVWSYKHSYVQLSNIEMKGVNEKEVSTTLFDDPNITKANESDAAAINGIAVTHNTSDDTGTITITGTVTLCDLYDKIKYDKVNNNINEPTISTLATTVTGKILKLGNYQLILAEGSKIQPCYKFEKIETDVVSSIHDANTNLEIALEDPNGIYKLIRLQDVISGNVTIRDETTDTVLKEITNFTGDLNLVLQSNSTNVSVYLTRDGYTNWATNIDLTTDEVFSFIINQAILSENLGNAATLENQTAELFLMRKILQKSQAIQTELNNKTESTINLNSINQPSATDATMEKQEELLELLKLILGKTITVRESMNN